MSDELDAEAEVDTKMTSLSIRPAALVLFVLIATQIVANGGTSGPTPERRVAAFRESKWESVTTWAALPDAWWQRFVAVIGVALAEKEAPWNDSDAHQPRRLNRRFVVAGFVKQRAVLIYEHGGSVAAPHQHAICLDRRDNGSYSLAANLIVRGISTTNDLQGALSRGRYRFADHF